MGDVARLAGETLCVGVPGHAIDEATRDELSALAPGAFVLFARNISSLAGTRELVAALLAAAGGDEPALVCVDQEGGRVARVRFHEALPSMMALGATGDAALAERTGGRLAADLRAIGANVNFAPVLDLALEGASTVIGTRSLGGDPQAVGELGAALVRAMESAGIATAPKHFPGHGATALDSHTALPTVTTSVAELQVRELVPFAAAFAAGARAVMSAHVVVTALDAARPATLSPAVLTTLLREKLGFDGVCFTDCLQMDAIAQSVGTARAAALALAAGADCCIVSHDLGLAREARDAIVAAVREGSLPYERLAAAAARVGTLRRMLENERATTAAPQDGELAREIAARAVTRVAGDVRLDSGAAVTVVSFEGATADGIAAGAAERPSLGLALRRRRMRAELLRVPLEPDPAMRETLLDVLALQGQRNVVIVARRAHVHRAQRETIVQLLGIAPHAIAVSALEPFDIGALAGARGVLCIFGDEEASIEALADVLCGRAHARGSLPVAAPSAVR